MVKNYCGKRYGLKELAIGFLIGSFIGFLFSYFIYGILVINIIFSLVFGAIGARIYIDYLVSKRRKEFDLEFCDYLDAIASSLSCGKNSYEAFLIANEDVHGLYANSAPICIESQRISNGLQSGRGIDELLTSMAARTKSEDVAIFADVFSICNKAGGNLKQTVNDTKQTLIEKISIENEIDTALTAPKNELNIMATMPLVITATLRLFSESLISEGSILVNTIAVCIFVFSYILGQRMVKIEV